MWFEVKLDVVCFLFGQGLLCWKMGSGQTGQSYERFTDCRRPFFSIAARFGWVIN